MRIKTPDNRSNLQPVGPYFPERRLEAAWDVLDRFACSLQARSETTDQVDLGLEAIRDSIKADAVYWDPGSTTDVQACAGRADLTPGWRQELTAGLIASDDGQSEDGQILDQAPPMLAAEGPRPVSVAMVRVSRSLNSWIVAMSFTPGRQFTPTDLKVMSLARRLLINHRQNLHMYGRLRESLFGLVRCLTATIEAKDPYTCGHSERVARIGRRIGSQMGLPESELGDIYLAGLLHDIGKIGVRDDLLLKPGPLNPEERVHIQQHTVIGDRVISDVRQLSHLRPGVRNHHERFDGKGYPDSLAGESIPLLARVLAVADSCDAMMSNRPYRKRLSGDQIDRIMAEEAGRMWDPTIVRHFMACRHDLYQIVQRGIGESMVVAVNQTINSNDESASTAIIKKR
jgi:HD-GYP domain-containing protein (c-di-GMP phosphodiesterase class II)